MRSHQQVRLGRRGLLPVLRLQLVRRHKLQLQVLRWTQMCRIKMPL
uniref:ORF1 n=1 Tax=Macrostomum lignano TaxID=282301 RepID=A0A1I8JAE2_9PLAT